MPTIRIKLPCIETADIAGKGVYASPLLAIFSVIKKGNGMVRRGWFFSIIVNFFAFLSTTAQKEEKKRFVTEKCATMRNREASRHLASGPLFG
ncbi:MAG: hypothetical protein IJX19_04560 [Clostridia bacterium]|nr:hypothetical protein [Clostridia bacterium]